MEELIKLAKRLPLFHDPSGSAGYYAQCNYCSKGNAEKERIEHRPFCAVKEFLDFIARAEGREQP